MQFPGLDGVLPGFGVAAAQRLGAGLRDPRRQSRRTGPGRRTRRATFGHFGQSGTFIWVDPAADLALVVLTDRDFGDWAHAAVAGAL